MMQTPLRNRRGTTLIETLVAVTLLSMVIVGTVALLTGMMRIWAKGSSGTTANQSASLALNQMIREVEEGKSASVASGKLVVVYPGLDTSTGDYNRGSAGATVTFYRSGDTGTESTGDNLWKSVAGGAKTRLAKNISRAEFKVPDARMVQIELTGLDQEGGSISPKTVKVTLKLRNS